MKRTAALLVLAGALLVPLAGCGSDSDSSEGANGGLTVEEMVAGFEAVGAPTEEAECVANELEGEGVTQEQLDSFFDAESVDDADPDFSELFVDAQVACGLQ